MTKRSRRQFLEESMFSAVAAIGAVSATSSLASAAQPKSANEKLGVVVVGCGGRGNDHLHAFSSRQDTEVLYVVDADKKIGENRADEVAKRQKRRPKVLQDMRLAFEDPSVDIVTTATPNHWHSLVAIWAMQHGKDVYVEKPVSHNVSEGRRCVEVARKYQRICQTGTQSRSMTGMRDAMRYIHGGKIGEVKLARGLCYKPRGDIGARGEYQPPEDVDYNLWLGPAPEAKVTRPKFHYDWHWQWAYGNGDLGNQGIHQMDLCRWALNVDSLSQNVISYGGRLGYEDAGETANTQIVIHDFGTKTLVFEVRGLRTGPYKGAGVGIIVEGEGGYVVMGSYEAGAAFDKDGKLIEKFSGGGDHYDNFVQAVRSRRVQELQADILEGHLSSALCHTGNISYRLGGVVSIDEAREKLGGVKCQDNVRDTFDRTIEHLKENGLDLAKTQLQFGSPLRMDPAKETFVDNGAANAMLTREYRTPFVVPAADKI